MYIPPHSSHPPGLMKSLVFGLLLTYYLQNTFSVDFTHMTQLLFTRLIARGHQASDIRPLFLEATEWLEARYDPLVDNNKPSFLDSSTDNVLFFHIPFHSRDISRRKIRDIYERTCETGPNGYNFLDMPNDLSGRTMHISRLTVAYSKPKNLRDILCPSKLAETDQVYLSKFLSK